MNLDAIIALIIAGGIGTVVWFVRAYEHAKNALYESQIREQQAVRQAQRVERVHKEALAEAAETQAQVEQVRTEARAGRRDHFESQ